MIRNLALGVAAAAAAGVGWAIARRLTTPVGPRRFDLIVRDIAHDNDGDLIVLDCTDQTTADGIYNPLVRARRLGTPLNRSPRSRANSCREKDHGHGARPRTEGR